eukprot:CAMPEP_0184330338 /NCGR_PEP_ID=MMETSP1049-20130417/144632_1 /TAXON_ID=77928 /ORGANISM="Proteomonas sulcata, Strain CCMP704" /LENGTH=274 /DNA_ID=CAMNT_0026652769 /DNA_START=21 /DNA_END=845 /DNA_ORIENTATION=+
MTTAAFGTVATTGVDLGKLSDSNINLLGRASATKSSGTLQGVTSTSSLTLPAAEPPYVNFWYGYTISVEVSGQTETRIISAYSSGRVVTVVPAFSSTPTVGSYTIKGTLMEYRVSALSFPTEGDDEPSNVLFIRTAQDYDDSSFGQGILTGTTHGISACEAASYSSCSEWVSVQSPGYIDTNLFGFSASNPGGSDNCDRYLTDSQTSSNCPSHLIFEEGTGVTAVASVTGSRCFITGACGEGANVNVGLLQASVEIYVREFLSADMDYTYANSV